VSRRDCGYPTTDVARPARSVRFLGEPDKDAFGPAQVAELVCLLVLHDLTDEFSAVLREPDECLVDVVDSEHGAEVAQRIHRSVPVIGDQEHTACRS